MYKIFKAVILIVWIMDILNFPQLEMLDTTIPINTLAWILIWLFLPSTSITINKN
jgi:hypothetical protein